MAGETIKTDAICLRIFPWSRTSHIVSWLTPAGKITTSVKGALRPKSMFLGQYDHNYTCEIVYYVGARGGVHALRECSPVDMRCGLRDDFRSLALADYYRSLVGELSPSGPECEQWYELLETFLSALPQNGVEKRLAELLSFEMEVLDIVGLKPAISAGSGGFELRGERIMPVSFEIAECLKNPRNEKNLQILLDASRVIGVFYKFHVDCSSEIRRTVLSLILNHKQGSGTNEY